MRIENPFFLGVDLRLDTTRLSYRGNSSSAFNIVQDFQFAPYVIASNPGYVKCRVGSAWALKPVKVWTGSAWVQKPLKFWNGTSWVLA